MDTAGDTTGTTADIGNADGPARPDARAASWDLPALPAAAAAARALTAAALHDWRVADPDDADDVVLIVDELVTNAVLHGTGPVRLRLRLTGRRLTGEVTDGRAAAPPPPPADVPIWDEAGRGLLLVAALATDYGTRAHGDTDGGGKTVWFSRLLTPGDGHRPAARPAPDRP
ncbi:ATP-binding protein [Actinomadura rifamycini]|uniref:ATP-binding protein n=1 Tax=Actinomadura rifamycini TaxID=31962 RepID=UPI000403DA96|nr:ATP-binding protein [Actinomadura rifamycini]